MPDLETAVITDHSAGVGEAIPDIAHAVSVSLPSWKSCVGYEEGEDWVISKMKNGYPRFFVHLSIQALANEIVQKYGEKGETAFLFPATSIAEKCLKFIERLRSASGEEERVHHARVLDLVWSDGLSSSKPVISALLARGDAVASAKRFWQHTGEGISSRRAEFWRQAFDVGMLMPPRSKGPRRYQKDSTVPVSPDGKKANRGFSKRGTPNNSEPDMLPFVEERFGRNLDLSLSTLAKRAIKKRIAGSLTADTEPKEALAASNGTNGAHPEALFTEDDVLLYPTGMSSIFNSHQMLLDVRGSKKSIMFGFPYVDTLKILENFGPGALFYPQGSEQELDDLEKRCKSGEKYLAVFCEFPGNPLLKTPNLRRMRKLADEFDFAIVVDETIGNFLNVQVLPAADIVVSSLTKVFSGDSNVMGGSLVLNPKGNYYQALQDFASQKYQDNYWPEDAVFMERNSRDFVSRNQRININADAVCDLLKKSSRVKEVYYPKLVPSRKFYDEFRLPNGGYGGLFSVTFFSTADAIAFYDTLETAKGPSLGTNFTLVCPFVILAHYNELEWARSVGVEADLVRMSVGLEDTKELCSLFARALEAMEKRPKT